MKFKSLFFGILALASAESFAINYGGAIFNNSKLKNTQTSDGKLKADQMNQASLWIKAPFSNEGTSFFTAQGTYQFEKDFDSEADATQYLNLDMLEVEFNRELEEGKLVVTAGRFSSYDLTGIIFSQQADGIQLSLIKPAFTFKAFGAYTGLLNANMNAILDNTRTEYEKDTEKFYDMAQKFAVAGLTLSLPNLFVNQTLSIEGFGTFHLEDENFNRIYGTLGLNGPLSQKVFYGLTSTLALSSFDGGDYETANFSNASLSYYGDFKSSAISLTGSYASQKFIGFTSNTAVSSNGPSTEYAQILKGGISASIKPVEIMMLSGSADAIFTPTDKLEYTGFQYGIKAELQPVSDFYIGAALTQYFDKEESDFNKTTVELKARLVF